MKEFRPLLNQINDKLELPQPLKSRIILEIADDMEHTYQFYLEKGYEQKEAFFKTNEKFEMDQNALNELVLIHQSGIRKWLDKLSEQAQNRWERFTLSLLFFIIVLIGLKVIVSIPIFTQISNFIWLVLSIAFINLGIVLWKFYSLYIKKDHHRKRLPIGIPVILYLGIYALAAALLGYFVELFNAGRYALLLETKLIYMISVTDSSFGSVLENVTEWSLHSSFLMMIGLLVLLISAFFWFLFENKITNIQRHEARYLLSE